MPSEIHQDDIGTRFLMTVKDGSDLVMDFTKSDSLRLDITNPESYSISDVDHMVVVKDDGVNTRIYFDADGNHQYTPGEDSIALMGVTSGTQEGYTSLVSLIQDGYSIIVS